VALELLERARHLTTGARAQPNPAARVRPFKPPVAWSNEVVEDSPRSGSISPAESARDDGRPDAVRGLRTRRFAALLRDPVRAWVRRRISAGSVRNRGRPRLNRQQNVPRQRVSPCADRPSRISFGARGPKKSDRFAGVLRLAHTPSCCPFAARDRGIASCQDNETAHLQALQENGSDGTRTATSGVTGRYGRTGCDPLRPAATRHSLCGMCVVGAVPDSATARRPSRRVNDRFPLYPLHFPGNWSQPTARVLPT
jgi:hypothetical protein